MELFFQSEAGYGYNQTITWSCDKKINDSKWKVSAFLWDGRMTYTIVIPSLKLDWKLQILQF